MSLEGGYFVGRHLVLRALADSQLTQGGFNLPQDFPELIHPPPVVDEHFFHHDQSGNINSLNLGGGIDVALGRRWDVFAALTTSVWGENGHAMRTGLSLGISWSFRTPWARATHADIAPPTTSTHSH